MSAEEQRKIALLEKEVKKYRKFLGRLENTTSSLVKNVSGFPEWLEENTTGLSPILKRVLTQLYAEERQTRKAVYTLLYKEIHQALYGKAPKTRKKRDR